MKIIIYKNNYDINKNRILTIILMITFDYSLTIGGVYDNIVYGCSMKYKHYLNRGGKMPSVVIVGAQWGDEGKGKIIDTKKTIKNVLIDKILK